MKKIFYFCNVKKVLRHGAAAIKQRFLCLQIRIIKRIEWVNGNVPKGSAVSPLTTRNTLIFV